MNLKDYDPTRVCEALGWLYGGEWAPNNHDMEKPEFCQTGGSRYVTLNHERCPALLENYEANTAHRIAADLAHALEVTAPWEWTRHRTGHWTCDTTEASAGLYEGTTPVPWWWNIGTMRHEDVAPDVESAQTAARAAYLTWMRGRLAMGEVTP